MKQGWISLSCLFVLGHSYYFDKDQNPDHSKYSHFPESERIEMREAARQMFQFGYDNYMKYAFPMDELNPIDCEGRGPDIENRDNININDILGDYSLTLVDTLDTLAVMGNSTEFKRAALLVIEFVSFDKNNTVQVFEASIRVLGGLLAAHLLIIDKDQPFGDIRPHMYDGELLYMAHDLASRLLPAFEGTATGIPYPRVNLRHGVPYDCSNETCTAGAGTLLLEFGMLSLLLNDPVYESVAKRTLKKLYSLRSNVTGLVGNVVNIQTGQWTGHMSGLGAGLDSYFEYMLKSFIQFGDEEALEMFNESYESINYYLRKGRPQCNNGTGNPPIYVNVNMKNGDLANNWIDALQAAWTGVQVLAGDIEEAICSHAIYYAIWRKYDALPERFNWKLKAPDVLFYPLRPELVESTYLLYQATKNPFYLHVGRDILNSLNNHTKAECGYATVHDVHKKDLEDRMESFFLSETCKYLYLLFDKDNHVNKHYRNYLFTTEGHLFPLNKKYRKNSKTFKRKKQGDNSGDSTGGVQPKSTNTSLDCDRVSDERRYSLPMLSKYLAQLESAVGLT